MTDEERRQLAEQWDGTRNTFRGLWNELRVVLAQQFLCWAVWAAPDTVDGRRIVRHVRAWTREAKESVEFEMELRRMR